LQDKKDKTDLLTYPTQTRFALGSHLDRHWSSLRAYRPFTTPPSALGNNIFIMYVGFPTLC